MGAIVLMLNVPIFSGGAVNARCSGNFQTRSGRPAGQPKAPSREQQIRQFFRKFQRGIAINFMSYREAVDLAEKTYQEQGAISVEGWSPPRCLAVIDDL